jgi:hypothetical protein
MVSKLRDFILSHSDSWEQELAAAPYCLKIKYDGELVMFSYNQLESDFSLPEVREARGIIFNYTTWECVCRAFDKFGNYGESYVPEIDWSTAFVSEKIDGSLMKVYYCDGCWMLATNGTINAFDAMVGDAMNHTFGDLFNIALHTNGQTWFTQKLDTNKCYMFELVSPYTTVVVPHKETNIYFLGSRDLTTGQEYIFAEEPEIAALFDTPRIYPMTKLDEVTDAASALPWDDEGYVVCDANKNRCKIKSPAYVRAHYMRTNGVVTLKRLVSVLLNNEQEEFLIYAPEWQEAIFKILSAMEHLSTTAYVGTVAFKLFSFKNKKEYYNFVSSNIGNKEVMAFLLKLYDRPDFTWQEYTENWDVHRWTRCLENEVEI